MNPWDLSASDLLVWGVVLHLIADWPLQNDWMANNKMQRRMRHVRPSWDRGTVWTTPGHWFDRHPAAYVHAAIHGALLALVFGWVAAPLALVHLIIDCRWPVAKWSRFVRQTQPSGKAVVTWKDPEPLYVVDIGTEVRFWTDQVFHIACVAIAALVAA